MQECEENHGGKVFEDNGRESPVFPRQLKEPLRTGDKNDHVYLESITHFRLSCLLPIPNFKSLDEADIHRLNKARSDCKCPALYYNQLAPFLICPFAHLEFSLPAIIYQYVLVSD